MIKTAAIIAASAASLGASTPTTAQNPLKLAAPAHFEIMAGPLNIVREDGKTHLTMDASSDSLLRIELSSGKTLNIQL